MIMMDAECADWEECAERIYGDIDRSKNEFVTVIIGAGASASIKTNDLKNNLTENTKWLGKEVFKINAMVHFGKELENCTLEELFLFLQK